ncbi:HTH domain-containing protein [Labilibaculum manganireducens]|uniref:HTH domain-containing protein n=1 Tax=Labilibaculum manganireducens TaxID=1940525 RepID=UPI000C6E6E6B|nr:HTH domain-containing protein [Labilibaculum manganireducens]
MNITQNKELMERVMLLAKNKSTGTPNELSDKLGVSERNLYRILDSIKDLGIAISYSRTLQSYILE